MEENKNQDLCIYTIQVKPYNFRFCHYIINDGQLHSKDYKELETYLISLLPEKDLVIMDLMGRKRHFVVFLQEKRIEEFEFDFAKENFELSKKILHEDIQSIQLKELAKNKNLNSDDTIKSISQRDLFSNYIKKNNPFYKQFTKK